MFDGGRLDIASSPTDKMSQEDHKIRYVDKAVQTDDYRPRSPSASSTSTVSLAYCSPMMTGSDTSASSQRRSSTNVDSPSTQFPHLDEDEFHSNDSSPSHSISTITRAYKRQHTPFSRPLGLKLPKGVSARIVSLPETVSAFSAQATLEKITTRVVSMPLPSSHSPGVDIDDLNDSPREDRSLVIDSRYMSRAHAQLRTSGALHTPSPPSSPESVVIIANKNTLSEGFLRGNVHGEDTALSQPDGEGWITWAKSPPRPIPALHGPLSLPYARCPSGAEGTVIEEQDNLPRMIWGLEGEDTTFSRSRTDYHQSSGSSQPSRQAASHVKQTSIPPRFQNTKAHGGRTSIPQVQPLGSRVIDSARHDRQLEAFHLQHRQNDSAHLRGQDPIELNDFVRQQPDTPESDYLEYDFSTLKVQSPAHDLPLHDLAHDTGLDWRTVLLAQQRLRNSYVLSPSASSLASVSDFDGRLRPFTPVPLPSLDSRSPLTLEHLGQIAQLPEAQNAGPRRMSALEIAQKYRQQQILQQQKNLLPTPPSSSSPIWSSSFSPYQGSIVSPEILAAARMPQNGANSLQTSAVIPPLHTTKSLRKSPHVGSAHVVSRHLETSSLAPSVQIEDTLTYGNRQIHDSTLNSLVDYLQHQSRRASSMTPVQQDQLSPMLPRQPPNTPLRSLANFVDIKAHQLARDANATEQAPPSPTSPKYRVRSFSHQHPRSIPLAKLIQRRLSSVPEEDAGLSDMERLLSSPVTGESGPSVPRMRSYSSGQSPAQSHSSFNDQFESSFKYLLSPPSPLHRGPAAASPRQTGNRSGSSSSAQAMVRLPGPSGSRGKDDNEGGRRRNGSGGEGGDSERSGHSGKEKAGGTGRGRGGRRGRGRGKKDAVVVGVRNGLERVDGGMVVKS